jgi:uncharacterized protein involved in tellurium resistance
MDFAKEPLGSVSLDKGGHARISLDKEDHKLTVTASLEWDGGSEARRQRGADLDLYTLYVTRDRVATPPPSTPAAPADRQHPHHHPPDYVFPQHPRGLLSGKRRAARAALRAELATRTDAATTVYYKTLGSVLAPPYLQLDGDSQIPGIETVRIVRPDTQGYALICAYSAVGNGVGSFRSFGARAVVSDGHGSTVTVPLYEDERTSYWVAIAFVDFVTDPEGLTIRHIERYSRPRTERRPVLHTDGTVLMDAGPVEFKPA